MYIPKCECEQLVNIMEILKSYGILNVYEMYFHLCNYSYFLTGIIVCK